MKGFKIKAIVIGLCLSATCWGQIPMLPDLSEPIPEWNRNLDKTSWPVSYAASQSSQVAQHYEQQVIQLAHILDSQFKKALEPLNHSIPAYQSKQFDHYLMALLTAGHMDECVALVKSKESKIDRPKPFLIAGLCESSQYHLNEASQWFKKATSQQWKNSSDYLESIFYRALHVINNNEGDVNKVLDLIPNATPNDKALWSALIHRIGKSDTGEITKNEIDKFLEKQIKINDGSFKGLLLAMQLYIANIDYKYDKGLKLLFSKANEMSNPLLWYYDAYRILYAGLDKNFAWSRHVYDVYNTYSHPWMEFPRERNTYNYSQLYQSVCFNQLVQPDEGKDFYTIKEELRKGVISISDALTKLDALKYKLAQKADFLSTYAGLLGMQGKHHQAMKMYWQAHRLCPYYNRSNWGMEIEKRFIKLREKTDYSYLVEQTLENREIPDSISTYITNWNAFNEDIQKRIIFGSRIWLPYMQVLKDNSRYSYIKFAFDLLSESPNLSDLRDKRIGGRNYPNDNRLWDDVRGIGGKMVVADVNEVYNTVQGDYNLLGHEIAHQFQFLLNELYQQGVDCIIKQYNRAKDTNNFPDPYSSYNKEEHFAQGVTYYLVPESLPPYFGLNVSWLKKHNIEQFDFIQAIDKANGNFNYITCVS